MKERIYQRIKNEEKVIKGGKGKMSKASKGEKLSKGGKGKKFSKGSKITKDTKKVGKGKKLSKGKKAGKGTKAAKGNSSSFLIGVVKFVFTNWINEVTDGKKCATWCWIWAV